MLARLIEILLAGFIFFIITICIFFLIQYLFFNINVNIAIFFLLVFTLFSGVCAMYGYGHYEAIYTGNKENLILVTFFSGLTLHLFLFLIGFDYLLIGEKAFYWLSGIFFFLSFKLWVVNDLISKYIKRITFFLGILFAVLAVN